MTKAQIEDKLRRLGARRLRHDDESRAIQESVAEVVKEAKGLIPMGRVAELLHMHRSTLYDMYVGEGADASHQRSMN